MTNNNCELVRRELDELMLDEACSAPAAVHLKGCSACREFRETQTKLRRMVGGLGTVAAPADFDFRLRARLANDSSGAFNYWPWLQRGFAVAAVLVVLGFGVVVVRNVANQQKETIAEVNPAPVPQQSPAEVKTTESKAAAGTEQLTARVPASGPGKVRSERSIQTRTGTSRQLSTVDFSSRPAEVLSGVDAVESGATAVIPIDASLHSLKLSLDDGRGNAKTISVPAIRFGSQRMLPAGNQFAQSGIW